MGIAIVLVLLGVLCMAGHATTQTILLKRHGIPKEDVLFYQHGIGALFLLPIALFFVSDFGFMSSKTFWVATLGAVLTGIIIQWSNVKSRQIADLSLVAPIQGLTPGLVTLTALLFGEFPSPQGMCGILMIMLGVWIHGAGEIPSGEKNGIFGYGKHYLRPFRWLFLPPVRPGDSAASREELWIKVTALRFAYLSASVGSIGLIFGGLIARNGSVAMGGFVSYSMLSLIFWIMGKKRRNASGSSSVKQETLWIILLMGALYGLHELLIVSAFRFGPIAYIGSLKRLSIIATMFLAWWFLGEKKAKKRLLPAVIITLGAILLAMDDKVNSIISHIN